VSIARWRREKGGGRGISLPPPTEEEGKIGTPSYQLNLVGERKGKKGSAFPSLHDRLLEIASSKIKRKKGMCFCHPVFEGGKEKEGRYGGGGPWLSPTAKAHTLSLGRVRGGGKGGGRMTDSLSIFIFTVCARAHPFKNQIRQGGGEEGGRTCNLNLLSHCLPPRGCKFFSISAEGGGEERREEGPLV